MTDDLVITDDLAITDNLVWRKRINAFMALVTLFALAAVLVMARGDKAIAASGDVPVVVVSIKPVHSIVAGVMAEVGAPHLLLEGRASPHSFQLRPSAARLLNKADLVVRVGPKLEAPLTRILSGLSSPQKVLELMDVDGMTVYKSQRGGRIGDEDEHGDHGDKQHDHGRGHGVEDPHIWLSVENGKVMAEVVAARLADIDPANKQAYERGLAKVLQQLDELEDRLAVTLGPLKGRRYMVFHDAFQYLTRPYGIAFAGAITFDPSLPARAGHLARLRARLVEKQASCVFTEPQYSPKIIRTLVESNDVKTSELDSLGVAVPAGEAAYGIVMTRLAAALARCLG